MKPRVLIIHDASEKYLDSIKTRFQDMDFEVCTGAEGAEAARRFDPQVVFSWKCAAIPPAVQKSIMAGPSVEWVHVAGAGLEHLLPLPAHLTLTNSSGVCSVFMAETVVGAILTWNFGFPQFMQQQRQRVWRQTTWTPLCEKTVLIAGLGHIGTAVARHAKTFGMRVLGTKNDVRPVAGVDEVYPARELTRILSRADYLCVHVPLTVTTRNLIGAEEFRSMKSSAILINTSRGGVVDEEALTDALRTGIIAGAYVDVFNTEPLPSDSALWDVPNLIISPHVADSVADWDLRFAEFFAGNLERWRRGEPVRNLVDPGRGY